MEILLTIIHIVICFGLIVVILLQKGKGGGLSGSAFGGGGGGSQVFGGAGAGSFLTKVTAYLALGFFITCIGLWYTSRSMDSVPETAAERMMGERTPAPMEASGAFSGTPQPLGESGGTASDTEGDAASTAPAGETESAPAESESQ